MQVLSEKNRNDKSATSQLCHSTFTARVRTFTRRSDNRDEHKFYYNENFELKKLAEAYASRHMSSQTKCEMLNGTWHANPNPNPNLNPNPNPNYHNPNDNNPGMGQRDTRVLMG